MNWKLVFQLSLFGLAMGIGTVFFIPTNVEPVFWLIIFILSAWIIVRRRSPKPFLHGVVLGFANSVWISLSHVIFFDRYLASHSREAAMMASMPLPNSPRLMMVIVGPLVGLITGAIIGLLAQAGSKIVGQPKQGGVARY